MIIKLYKKFLGLWRSTESIGGRVARGGAIILVKRFLTKGFQLVRTLVVARLLFPNDVGLFTLASLFLGAIEIFFNPGLGGAIVQSNDNAEGYLDSVWTLNLIRAIFLTVLFWFIAPIGGYFFHNTGVVAVIRIMGFYYLIAYAENVGMSLMSKELRYDKLFFYDMSSVVAQIGTTIIAAFIFRNVWALVAGMFAARIAGLVASFVLHPYRPKLNFKFVGIKKLFKFGKWLYVAGIVTFFVSQGDSLTVGKLLSSSNLAFYQMAFALGTLPALELVGTLSNMFFPLFSKIKDDRERLKSAFLRILRIIFGAILPATFGLAVLAPEIIRYVYGERWLAMIPILYIVIIYGFIQSFDSLFTPILQGIGKPQTTFAKLLVQAVVMFSLIVPLTYKYGAMGAAMAITAGLFISEAILFFKVKKEINFGVFTFFRSSVLPFFASLGMAALVFSLKTVLPIHGIWQVLGLVVSGAIFYLAILFILDEFFGGKFYESFLWLKVNI